MPQTTPLAGCTNLGPAIIKRLEDAGVSSLEDLRRIGPAAVYRRICAQHPGTTVPVCYYLYSLEGALRGVHWNDLPRKVKDRLVREAGR